MYQIFKYGLRLGSLSARMPLQRYRKNLLVFPQIFVFAVLNVLSKSII